MKYRNNLLAYVCAIVRHQQHEQVDFLLRLFVIVVSLLKLKVSCYIIVYLFVAMHFLFVVFSHHRFYQQNDFFPMSYTSPIRVHKSEIGFVAMGIYLMQFCFKKWSNFQKIH